MLRDESETQDIEDMITDDRGVDLLIHGISTRVTTIVVKLESVSTGVGFRGLVITEREKETHT